MLITAVKPNTTRDEAARRFKESMREARRGRLQAVIDFYVPYRLFQVDIINGGKAARSLFAIDSVSGRLDLYSFDQRPSDDERVDVETLRVAPSSLDESQSFAILKERLRRQYYLKGFFKIKDLEISGGLIADLYLPYWVGIYRRNDRARLEVLDALRNSFEGAKLREIVTRWFVSPPAAKLAG